MAQNRSSMEKQKYPHAARTVANGWVNDEGGKFNSYNPIPLRPTDANQMPPTDAEPLRRRYQAAGGC